MNTDRGHVLYLKLKDPTPGMEPDAFSSKTINTLVLCRDSEGNPTAIYSDNVWDFNPYRLSERRISKIDFTTIFDDSSPNNKSLVKEIKHILYHLIYASFNHAATLKTSGTSAIVLYYYFRLLARLAVFCRKQEANQLVGEITIKECLSNPVYLNAFLHSDSNKTSNTHKSFSGLISTLSNIGKARLGFTACSLKDLRIERKENMQHPVIPVKIYLAILNKDSQIIDAIYPYRNKLSSLIKEFKNPLFANRVSTQKLQIRAVKDKVLALAPTLPEALKEHGLTSLFRDEFHADSRTPFVKVLGRMLYILKRVIQFYTGMREQELARLRIGCLKEKPLSQAIHNANGDKIEPSRMIHVISTTTKYTGYKKQASWLAPKEAVKAIRIAESIAKPLAALYGIEESQCSIFCSPFIIRKSDFQYNTFKSVHKINFKLFATTEMRISEQDILELKSTDPSRDLSIDPKFSIGKLWPLQGHQFRRSLAFYASNSGFVNISTLSSQFKHVSIQMSQYYRKNFEGLKTIFGSYDPKSKEFKLPKSHPALEYQMAVPISIANQFLSDVLNEGSIYHGAQGKYLESQRGKLNSGVVSIKQFRSDTMAEFRAGKVAYRKTLLGGCMKVGSCDNLLMGEFTKCLSCPEAIIKSDKLNNMINALKEESGSYPDDSVEKEIVSAELRILLKYKKKFEAADE